MKESCGSTHLHNGAKLPRCHSRTGCRQCWEKHHRVHGHLGPASSCGLCGAQPPHPLDELKAALEFS